FLGKYYRFQEVYSYWRHFRVDYCSEKMPTRWLAAAGGEAFQSHGVSKCGGLRRGFLLRSNYAPKRRVVARFRVVNALPPARKLAFYAIYRSPVAAPASPSIQAVCPSGPRNCSLGSKSP